MEIPELTNNELRGIASLILVILTIAYLIIGSPNQAVEYILLALAGFVIGAIIKPPTNGVKK